jgi:hypothetical protein
MIYKSNTFAGPNSEFLSVVHRLLHRDRRTSTASITPDLPANQLLTASLHTSTPTQTLPLITAIASLLTLYTSKRHWTLNLAVYSISYCIQLAACQV